jgi:geranylgeranyl diphosphate synthase type II
MKELTKFSEILNKKLEQSSFPLEPKGLYQPLDYFMRLGGKRLRPMLTLMGAEAFGLNPEKVAGPAIGIELFHNFTLIHDDIMDAAPLRRGKETVHKKWNLNTAILSGDVLFVDSIKKISEVESKHLPEVLALFLKTAQEVCEGQQWDMDFEERESVSESEYIKMIQFKTSVLLGCALQIGAIVAGASKEDAQHIYDFGLTLGTSFQIKDDLLDAFGDPEKFGKQVGGDILANKKTMLLIKALELANEEQRASLEKWIAKNDAPTEKINAIKKLFEETGAKSSTQNAMDSYYHESVECLKALSIDESHKHPLFAFADWLYNREV